jgi:uncharacterized protein with von Willebrand factor type A (vWA) domain
VPSPTAQGLLDAVALYVTQQAGLDGDAERRLCDTLRSQQQRLDAVYRAMAAVHVERLPKLLPLLRRIEDRVLSPESLAAMSPKELLRAAEYVRSGLENSAEFVRQVLAKGPSPWVEETSQRLGRILPAGENGHLSPDSREKLRKILATVGQKMEELGVRLVLEDSGRGNGA